MVSNLLSWIFGIAAFTAGLINIFFGNDPGFGIFIMLLALLYFPLIEKTIKRKTGFVLPVIAKITLAIFMIWAVLGVGELFAKIELIRMFLKNAI